MRDLRCIYGRHGDTERETYRTAYRTAYHNVCTRCGWWNDPDDIGRKLWDIGALGRGDLSWYPPEFPEGFSN